MTHAGSSGLRPQANKAYLLNTISVGISGLEEQQYHLIITTCNPALKSHLEPPPLKSPPESWRASRRCSTGVTATATVTRAAGVAITATAAVSHRSCPASIWVWAWSVVRDRETPPRQYCLQLTSPFRQRLLHPHQWHRPKCTTSTSTRTTMPAPTKTPTRIQILDPITTTATATTTLSDQ